MTRRKAPAPAPAPKPRRAGAERRERILESLIAGLPVIRIARMEQITVRRVRQIVAGMLEKRELDPAAGFAQIQIARLSEAMIVAHDLMREGDLAAMDRFIKLARELDRYHGFFPGRAPAKPKSPRLAPPETPRLPGAAPEREIFLPPND